MSDAYRELLDSAIDHLQSLKRQGVRFVSVTTDSLSAITESPRPAAPKAVQSAPAATRPIQRPVTPTAPVQRLAPTIAPVEPVPTISVPAGITTITTSPLSPDAKAAAFAELRQRVLACVKCSNLAAARKNVVFGVGNINAELMFVGEAPGADEDEQGEPFVGKAGQLLTKIIQTMGLSRETVYIANILKCRPDTPGQAAGNRKPTAEEMQTCIPFLHDQIDLIRPKVLVALGATAVEGLLGKTVGITKLRGNWQTYRGIPLMPTYHPAYLLRNQALSEKRRVWEDMLQVMEKLSMPISEKQRGYFLKA
jgi:uracil-DNA glycosylase